MNDSGLKQPARQRVRDLIALTVCVALCYAVGAMGSVLFAGARDGWYASLAKPAFTPPGWIFGPVWTVLYICMGVAAWLVWRRLGLQAGAGPLGLFAIQLALNGAWMPLFSGLRSPGWAFADIVALWVMIVWTTARFFAVRRLAGWLMVPYLAWTSFAAVLNFAIWQLNC